jgi:hypothetical protein
MRNIVTLISATALALILAPAIALAQDSKSLAKKAEINRPIAETVVNRDVFSGNEARIGAMNWVNADCTSGPVPALRITTAPQNGELRQEEITMPVDRRKDDPRFDCNGKPVTAIAVHYTPKGDFKGKDNVVIDVDFKTGTVKRFNYKITVR